MSIKIATDIETELWNRILKFLTGQHWKVINQYPNIFDKGIDQDFYTLKKNGEIIELGWTNWFEGEIKSSEKRLQELEKEFDVTFTFNEPESL